MWVEVNKKWDADYIEPSGGKTYQECLDSLTPEIQKLFGTTFEDIRRAKEDLFLKTMGYTVSESFNYEQDEERYKEYKEKKKPIEELENKIWDWVEEQDIILEHQERTTKIIAARKRFLEENTFSHSSLNRPGIEIDVKKENGEIDRHIIGTINTLGGSCNCCCSISDEDVVLRYRDLSMED